MKKAVGFLIAVMFMFTQVGTVSAAPVVRAFTVSATIQAATGITQHASSFNPSESPVVFTDMDPGGSQAPALPFGTLTYNSSLGIFLPSIAFAIDIGPVGSGNVDTTVTYNEGARPTGASSSLGYKTIATFMKVTTAAPAGVQIAKRKLIDLVGAGQAVTSTQVSGGWLRVYIGIATGDTTGANPDPAGSTPFSAADATGNYTGVVTITSTLS